MASPAAVLSILVTANTGQAKAALTSLDRQLVASSRTAKTSSNGVATAAKYSSLAVLAVGAAGVKMSADFDNSMRNVNSIAGLSEQQFGKLKESVLDLAGPTAQTPKTLAEGMYDLVSSGFDASESLTILKSSAKAATAGLTDAKTSTSAVAAVLNAYRRPASDAAQVSDDLFQTVNRGVITFKDLAQNIGDTLPFAASLGIDLKQVGAATSTMTKQGLSAPETFTRIRNVMQALIKPSVALQDAYTTLGVTSGEQLVKQKGFQGALEALTGATDGSKEAIAKLFPNIRALGGVLALTGNNTKDAQADLAAFQNTAGATDKVFAEQSKSVGLQLNRLWAQISVMLIKVGDAILPALIPVVSAFADVVGKMADAFSALPAPVQTAIVALGLVTAAVVLLASVFAPAIFAVAGLSTALTGLAGGSAAAAATGVTLRGLGLSFLTAAQAAGPYALVIGGAVAATYAVHKAFQAAFPHTDKFGNALAEASEGTRKITSGLNNLHDAQMRFKTAQQTINNLEAAGRGLPKELGKAYQDWAQAFVDINDARAEHQAGLKEAQAAIQKMRDALQDAGEAAEYWRDQLNSADKDSGQFKTAQKYLENLKDQQNQLLNAVIAYRRAKLGKDPVSSQAAEALSGIRAIAGQKVAATIGITGTDATIRAIGIMQKQLTKWGQTTKVAKILANSSSANEAIAKLKALLASIHDKRVKITTAADMAAAIAVKSYLDTIKDKTVKITTTGKGGGPFASGTKSAPGGMAIVNERGPEMARYPNGQMGMLGNAKGGAQLAAIPKGTEIFTAAQTRKLLASGIPGFAGGTSGAAAMMRMIDFGKREAAKHGPYKWGGGHSGFTGPYDCSGFVSAILHAGGLLSSPMTTDGLKNWGKSGSTGGVVVGVRGSTGRSAHTMMRVGHTYFESGGNAGGASIVSGWDGSFPIKRTAGEGYSLKGAGRVAAKPMSAKQVFGNRYSINELATLAKFVGMKNPEIMAAIAMAETRGNPDATGKAGEKGLWQILEKTARDFRLPWDHLYDPVLNAKGAKAILAGQGLTAWSTYKNGAYKKYLGGKVSAKKLKKLRGVGTKGLNKSKEYKLPAIFQGPLDALTSKSDIADDYAQRAEKVGMVNGRDQFSYLNEELQALLELRNTIIKAHLYLVQMIKQANKRLAKMPRGNAAQKKAYQNAAAWRNGMSEKDADLLSSLEELHGKGSPLDIITSEPALGYLGGRILDVQMALKGSGVDKASQVATGPSDDTLRALVKDRQYPVFANFPFAGVFHKGGQINFPAGVSEGMAWVKDGERVLTEDQQRGVGGPQFFDIYIGGEKIAEHVQASMRGELSMARRRS